MSRLKQVSEVSLPKKRIWAQEIALQMEEFWKAAAQAEKNPLATAIGKERIRRTKKNIPLKQSPLSIADIGSGFGTLSSWLVDRGANLTAIDAASNALCSRFSNKFLFTKEVFPYLRFSDENFDGILLCDVIAEIDPHLHRLCFSELARLLKKKGWIVLSTELDLDSEDAQQQFLFLVKTEFTILKKEFSYHRLYLCLQRILGAPKKFSRACKDKNYRLHQLQKRRAVLRLFFYLNTLSMFSYLWQPLSILMGPLSMKFRKNRRILLFCEKLSKFLWPVRGITHVIVTAERKSLSQI